MELAGGGLSSFSVDLIDPDPAVPGVHPTLLTLVETLPEGLDWVRSSWEKPRRYAKKTVNVYLRCFFCLSIAIEVRTVSVHFRGLALFLAGLGANLVDLLDELRDEVVRAEVGDGVDEDDGVRPAEKDLQVAEIRRGLSNKRGEKKSRNSDAWNNSYIP